MSSTGHCLHCGDKLSCIDDDPNGDGNAVCARCSAEEEHDYDIEPGVEFERDGRRKGEDLSWGE